MTKTADKPVRAPVRLLYATWDDAGERHEVGDVIELPVADAKRLIAEGKAERADPMPGEE